MSERIYPEGYEFGNGDFYVCDFDTVASGVLASPPPVNVRQVRRIGGIDDDLGINLTPKRVNSSGFGVRVRYRGTGASGTVTIHGIRVRVHYQPPAGANAPSTDTNVVQGLHPAWTSVKILPSGRIVVAGTAGRMRYSDDNGQTWTNVSLPDIGSRTINDLEAIGKAGVAAVGNLGYFATSTDGVTWSRKSLENSVDLAKASVLRSTTIHEYLLFTPTQDVYRKRSDSKSGLFDQNDPEFLAAQSSLGTV